MGNYLSFDFYCYKSLTLDKNRLVSVALTKAYLRWKAGFVLRERSICSKWHPEV